MKRIAIYICCLVALASCQSNPQPKPYAYFRIDLPPYSYHQVDSLGPYTTEISDIATPVHSNAHWSTPEDTWINVYYPALDATIHLSHKHITKSWELDTLTEESRTLVYKHTIRADAIRESYYENTEKKVYCVFYELTGNAASPTQFYATDSAHNFLRGAVYFNTLPNYDSVAPCAIYIENDLVHMIETLEWTKE